MTILFERFKSVDHDPRYAWSDAADRVFGLVRELKKRLDGAELSIAIKQRAALPPAAIN
jgi:hypothetical protein